MAGIKETKEAVQGVFAVVRKGFEIRNEGVAGLPKLIALYPTVQLGIQGGDQIDDEMKDLTPEEGKALFTLLVTEMGETLDAAGIKGLNKYLGLLAKAIDAGEVTYSAWAPVIAEMQAVRAQPAQ